MNPFLLADGRKLHSLHDLYAALTDMSDETFNLHVDESKNDFANWIRDCLKRNRLAIEIRAAKTRHDITVLVLHGINNHVYETIIIGTGVAGLTAALYASRNRMDYLLLGKEFGGQIAVAGSIENWPGTPKTNYMDFMKGFEEQAKLNHVEIVEEEVKHIKKQKDHFKVITNKREYLTQSIIIATGARPRKLDVPGEQEFDKKGVTYCAWCDGPLFKNKPVVVVGGGDAGLEAADVMQRIASKVTLIEHGPKIRGHKYLIERVTGKPNIDILTSTEVVEITGENFVKTVIVKQGKKKIEILSNAVIIEIGRMPNTEFAKNLIDLDQREYIEVDKQAQTKTEGIFAAGDCSDIGEAQFSIAAGQGCIALLKALKYTQKKKKKV